MKEISFIDPIFLLVSAEEISSLALTNTLSSPLAIENGNIIIERYKSI